MAITLRTTKGSELTYAELDGNFTDLDSRLKGLPDSSQVSAIILNDVDAAYIQARQADIYRDSAFITGIIDSSYIQARQTDIYRDSAFVTNIIDSAYIQAREASGGGAGGLDSAAVTSLVDSSYVETRVGKVLLDTYTTATVPAAVDGQLIFVSDGDAGNPCLAVYSAGDYYVVSSLTTIISDSGGGF